MKRNSDIRWLENRHSSFRGLLGTLLTICAAVCIQTSCSAVQVPNGAPLGGGQISSPFYLASKFSALDDLLGGIGRSSGKPYRYSYQGAQREERRGEHVFFYYVFQTILRLSSGLFLAVNSGMLVERLKKKKGESISTVVAIVGFVFSLFCPWIGLAVGGGCFGLRKLADEPEETPPDQES